MRNRPTQLSLVDLLNCSWLLLRRTHRVYYTRITIINEVRPFLLQIRENIRPGRTRGQAHALGSDTHEAQITSGIPIPYVYPSRMDTYDYTTVSIRKLAPADEDFFFFNTQHARMWNTRRPPDHNLAVSAWILWEKLTCSLLDSSSS